MPTIKPFHMKALKYIFNMDNAAYLYTLSTLK
jgi:hypothetical protein